MKLTIVGMGYVGLANGVLLSKNNEVVILDICDEKIAKLNQKKSPIKDKKISEYLETNKLNIRATLNKSIAYENSEFLVI